MRERPLKGDFATTSRARPRPSCNSTPEKEKDDNRTSIPFATMSIARDENRKKKESYLSEFCQWILIY